MDIQGKTALVTGAASGIGRAAVKMLAEKGAKAVAAADINGEDLASLKTEIEDAFETEVLCVETDLTQEDAVEMLYNRTLGQFAGLNIVFNNAGLVSGPPSFPETPLKRIRQVIELNLISVVQSTALGIQIMGKSGGGVIINTASTAAVNRLPTDGAYAASKAGIAHLSASCESFADALGVRVVALGPGVTETPILEMTGGGTRPDWLAPILEQIKILTPEDVAARFIELVEDDSIAGELILLQNTPIITT